MVLAPKALLVPRLQAPDQCVVACRLLRRRIMLPQAHTTLHRRSSRRSLLRLKHRLHCISNSSRRSPIAFQTPTMVHTPAVYLLHPHHRPQGLVRRLIKAQLRAPCHRMGALLVHPQRSAPLSKTDQDLREMVIKARTSTTPILLLAAVLQAVLLHQLLPWLQLRQPPVTAMIDPQPRHLNDTASGKTAIT